MPLAPIEPVTKLSELVLRVLGHNPGSFQLQGTNMYLVGSGASRILIDTGEGKEKDLPLLLTTMKEHGVQTLSDALITHYHHDHTGGIKNLLAHFGDALRVWKLPWSPGVLVPWNKLPHGPSFDMAALGVRMLSDGDVIKTASGDATLRVLATPGHTIDHCCFVLEEEGALFSGDHVLGGSSGVFDDLHSYMKSLDKALEVLPQGAGGRIYPGHGPVIEDGHKGLLDYIANRRMREAQVVDALKGRFGRTFGLSPYGIVQCIYPQLSLTLQLAAASNVEKTLHKLQKEGKARPRELSPCPIRVPSFLPLAGARVDVFLLKRWSSLP